MCFLTFFFSGENKVSLVKFNSRGAEFSPWSCLLSLNGSWKRKSSFSNYRVRDFFSKEFLWESGSRGEKKFWQNTKRVRPWRREKRKTFSKMHFFIFSSNRSSRKGRVFHCPVTTEIFFCVCCGKSRAGQSRKKNPRRTRKPQTKEQITVGGGDRGFPAKNKNRLSSTTCGEELQKIFKDWQSSKGLC